MSLKKILLVDDDRDFVSAIATMLSAKGYETKIANSGIEGYEIAQIFKPDLFILDVNMETFSAGFELNKTLRLNANFKTTPIIMLTGIDTMAASNQIVDMYNSMSGIEGFNTHKVVKIQNPDGTVAVDYINDSGQVYFLLLDSFISKPVDSEVLLKEVSRFLMD
jgi:CheY-like chemotaxis protein